MNTICYLHIQNYIKTVKLIPVSNLTGSSLAEYVKYLCTQHIWLFFGWLLLDLMCDEQKNMEVYSKYSACNG